MDGGGGGALYLTLYSHNQNDFCIKIGSSNLLTHSCTHFLIPFHGNESTEGIHSPLPKSHIWQGTLRLIRLWGWQNLKTRVSEHRVERGNKIFQKTRRKEAAESVLPVRLKRRQSLSCQWDTDRTLKRQQSLSCQWGWHGQNPKEAAESVLPVRLTRTEP